MGWLSKLFNMESLSSQPQPQAKPSPVGAGATAKADACNRLKLVLMHDRTKLSPGLLEEMRHELVAVISKYVEIDKDALELNLESESNTIALVANIPLLNARPRTHGHLAEDLAEGSAPPQTPTDADEADATLADFAEVAASLEGEPAGAEQPAVVAGGSSS